MVTDTICKFNKRKRLIKIKTDTHFLFELQNFFIFLLLPQTKLLRVFFHLSHELHPLGLHSLHRSTSTPYEYNSIFPQIIYLFASCFVLHLHLYLF